LLESPSDNSMFCEPVNCDEILKIIGNLKTNKSPGHDNLGPPKLVKNVADYVVIPIQHLFNMSFESGKVPYKLKNAMVIPIFTVRCYAMGLCPSVTSRCSTKTAKRRITQTTPHDSPVTLVF